MKLKKTFDIETILREEYSIRNFLETMPRYLGIDFNSIKDIELETQDDEYAQLESLKINFIPEADHSKLDNPNPWLTRNEKDVEIIKSKTDITWQENLQSLEMNVENAIRFANARDIKDTEEFKQFKENIKKLLD